MPRGAGHEAGMASSKASGDPFVASGGAGLSGQLGDVLISYPQAVRQAEEGDVELEIADLFVHGVLHILGYDHEVAEDADVMFPLQDKLVAEIL